MITKFNTGDAILIPARIVSAEERDGKITYSVDADIWNIPEDAIVESDKAKIRDVFRALSNTLNERR